MRIWKGLEMEGKDKGVMTLFVSSPVIGYEEMCLVKKYITDDIKVVYFGAGYSNTNYFTDSAIQIVENIKNTRKIKYVLETNNAQSLDYKIIEYLDNVIVRNKYCGKIDVSKIICKVEANNTVYIYPGIDSAYVTNLDNLKNGQFVGTDVELFNNEHEESI